MLTATEQAQFAANLQASKDARERVRKAVESFRNLRATQVSK